MVLSVISLVGSSFVVFGILYYALFYTIGRLNIMSFEIKRQIYLGDLLLPVIALIILLMFFNFTS